MSLDKVARKIASLGLPGVMFTVACFIASATGLAGGAVITSALALLGGPFGMVAGLGLLGASTLIGDAVSKYGIESLLVEVYKIKRQEGMSYQEIETEVNRLWLSQELKIRVLNRIKEC